MKIDEYLKEQIREKLRERGMKIRYLEGEEKERFEGADFVLESAGVQVALGKFVWNSSDFDTKKLGKMASSGKQVLVVVPKELEVELTKKIFATPLAGKVKFITWELVLRFK